MNPAEPFDSDAAGDYRQHARNFLGKSREYLADGDLHQASEKGWGAAAWIAKAVAETRGWEYGRHEQFKVVLTQARDLTDNYGYWSYAASLMICTATSTHAEGS